MCSSASLIGDFDLLSLGFLVLQMPFRISYTGRGTVMDTGEGVRKNPAGAGSSATNTSRPEPRCTQPTQQNWINAFAPTRQRNPKKATVEHMMTRQTRDDKAKQSRKGVAGLKISTDEQCNVINFII